MDGCCSPSRLVLLLSLTAGYALSRLALGPVLALGDAAAGINATNLVHPIASPRDRPTRWIALRGSSMVCSTGCRRRRCRTSTSFARWLTRSGRHLHSCSARASWPSTVSGPRPSCGGAQRVQRAGVQIRRRVSDLFLLAQAEAGESPALRERVELDQVVLEVVDLFRARAHALGQTLELGSIDEAVVRGDRHLLHEAAAELIENACRHGNRAVPVRIALVRSGSGARLEVENAGEPVRVATSRRVTRHPRTRVDSGSSSFPGSPLSTTAPSALRG